MAAVRPNTNMGASGDEADNSISVPSTSSASPCRIDYPRREAVTSDDVADGLLDEYEANAHDDVADSFLDEYEAICRKLGGPTARYPIVGRSEYPTPLSVVGPGDAPAGAPSLRHPASKQIVIDAVGQRTLNSKLRRGVSWRSASWNAAGDSRAARVHPWSGRPKLLRKMAGLPRDVTPLPVEAAPIGVISLVPSSDHADDKNSHVDTNNDDGNDGDDHGSDDDDDASHDDEQSSPQAPRDSSSQHGRNGSSNPSLTSPAPEPHDDSGASTEQTDAHDPTPTGQFLSLLPPLLSRAQRRSS